MTHSEFDEIRSFRDHEVQEATTRIAAAEQFQMIIAYLFGKEGVTSFLQQFQQMTSIQEFQGKIILNFLLKLEKESTRGITCDHLSHLASHPAHLFITNHRDIVLDSAFLNKCLYENNFNTSEIAIGDNLLIFPWITDLVRLNKSFIVKRGGSRRDLLQNSIRMSAYIRHDITERNESVWIAQREGRCKDSNDRTQESLLKMLALSGEGSIAQRLRHLHMCPIAISYEYDPCDYLKAMEFQQKRDNAEFKKSPADDLKSMQIGVMGYKGRVMFRFCEPMDDFLTQLELNCNDKTAQCSAIAQEIDRRIHSAYQLYPVNWIAMDWLQQTNTHNHLYTEDEKAQFEAYIQQRLDLIDLPNKDESFLREKLLVMYANPAINYLQAQQGDGSSIEA